MQNGQLLDTPLRERPQVLPTQSRRLNPWAWRIALMFSLLAVGSAALLTVSGERAVSDVFVTFAFTLGLLAAPLWLFAQRGPTD
ncbi:MAG: hypothetical protein H6526_02855 [Actinobacteria bacterium]|nr:hypothetical protein [Actinomycetota bacterium]MCB8997414.1 hypothetical protein [Actinomycetota bacterium]MCB9414202.1 hypothetical protein [Actinomycetota bacterium]HRY09545.1 hypothetical protein [Candidatus Nanopelagicales bacterium]